MTLRATHRPRSRSAWSPSCDLIGWGVTPSLGKKAPSGRVPFHTQSLIHKGARCRGGVESRAHTRRREVLRGIAHLLGPCGKREWGVSAYAEVRRVAGRGWGAGTRPRKRCPMHWTSIRPGDGCADRPGPWWSTGRPARRRRQVIARKDAHRCLRFPLFDGHGEPTRVTLTPQSWGQPVTVCSPHSRHL